MKVKELIEKLQQLDHNLEVEGLTDVLFHNEVRYTYYFLDKGVRVANVHISPAHVELILGYE